MMLQSFQKILNTSLHATDGKIGHLDDILFDDDHWTVRYLVVRTGSLLRRQRVLISPLGVAHLDWQNEVVRLNLTRAQIEASPDVDTDQPFFRQMEKRYFDYYNWPYYWSDMSVWGIEPRSSFMVGDQAAERQEHPDETASPGGNPHLRSFREVHRYALEAEGTRFGHVSDFLVEDKTWAIRYLLVDTKAWWPPRLVLVDPRWVQSVDWVERVLKVSRPKSELEASPEFQEGLDLLQSQFEIPEEPEERKTSS